MWAVGLNILEYYIADHDEEADEELLDYPPSNGWELSDQGKFNILLCFSDSLYFGGDSKLEMAALPCLPISQFQVVNYYKSISRSKLLKCDGLPFNTTLIFLERQIH